MAWTIVSFGLPVAATIFIGPSKEPFNELRNWRIVAIAEVEPLDFFSKIRRPVPLGSLYDSKPCLSAMPLPWYMMRASPIYALED